MPIAEVPENLDEILDCIEMVIAEEVLALKEAKDRGMDISPMDIAAGYLSPKYGCGKELSLESHTVGLACMVAIALHWLVCREA